MPTSNPLPVIQNSNPKQEHASNGKASEFGNVDIANVTDRIVGNFQGSKPAIALSQDAKKSLADCPSKRIAGIAIRIALKKLIPPTRGIAVS